MVVAAHSARRRRRSVASFAPRASLRSRARREDPPAPSLGSTDASGARLDDVRNPGDSVRTTASDPANEEDDLSRGEHPAAPRSVGTSFVILLGVFLGVFPPVRGAVFFAEGARRSDGARRCLDGVRCLRVAFAACAFAVASASAFAAITRAYARRWTAPRRFAWHTSAAHRRSSIASRAIQPRTHRWISVAARSARSAASRASRAAPPPPTRRARDAPAPPRTSSASSRAQKVQARLARSSRAARGARV